MSTKIQINSLEALERLIGGDTALEIEVRNSVVQDFATKHLKSIASSETVSKAIGEVKNALTNTIQEEVSKNFGDVQRYYNGKVAGVTLNPAISEEIKRQTTNIVSFVINDIITRYIDEHFVKNNEIEKIVEQKMKYFTEQAVKDEIRKKLGL